MVASNGPLPLEEDLSAILRPGNDPQKTLFSGPDPAISAAPTAQLASSILLGARWIGPGPQLPLPLQKVRSRADAGNQRVEAIFPVCG